MKNSPRNKVGNSSAHIVAGNCLRIRQIWIDFSHYNHSTAQLPHCFLSSWIIKYCIFILQRNISDTVAVALKNTQRALLKHRTVNQGPVVIQEDNINMLVDRSVCFGTKFFCKYALLFSVLWRLFALSRGATCPCFAFNSILMQLLMLLFART